MVRGREFFDPSLGGANDLCQEGVQVPGQLLDGRGVEDLDVVLEDSVQTGRLLEELEFQLLVRGSTVELQALEREASHLQGGQRDALEVERDAGERRSGPVVAREELLQADRKFKLRFPWVR